ncbi:MAG: helix-turn-helix domain-containing protein, partial [Muribaculaceae bacterium]
TAIDLVVVPLYTHILRELCRPGHLIWSRVAIAEVPFVALIVLFIATKYEPFYIILVGYAVAYGVVYAVWVTIEIPRYNHSLKERFSYQENINLEWLRYIMLSFFALLLLWTIDSISINLYIECGYLLGSLTLWMIICYFLYRHESIIEELSAAEPQAEGDGLSQGDCGTDLSAETPTAASEMSERIRALFIDKEFFLNPKLKLSDVAKQIGTNRTYLSNYFNRESGCTFFDYVNDLRIEYSCRLLTETDDTLDEVATNSGFNSLSTFRRAFVSRKHCTPNEYRLRAK